jgi:formylglycine-generating enzyme required for sulfatase activity
LPGRRLFERFGGIHPADPRDVFSDEIDMAPTLSAIDEPKPGPLSVMPGVFPSEWASCWGEDNYGVFQEFTYKNVIQRMRWIPPGKFMMGSPESEADRETNETQHEVILTQGFWLADTACTQELWEAVMGENPSSFKDDPHNPVERVSWEMVCGKGPHGGEGDFFLKRLNAALPGLDLCLPTEAQWEYACRAGTETAFWWGNELTTEDANYNGKYPYAGGAKGEYREKTVPVKTFKRNARGLWQMHGNVWEWCKDWFGPYPRGTIMDPGGADAGTSRVLRGGGWGLDGRILRSAYRFYVQPSYAWNLSGFRLARGHEEQKQGWQARGAERSEAPGFPPARRTGEAAER